MNLNLKKVQESIIYNLVKTYSKKLEIIAQKFNLLQKITLEQVNNKIKIKVALRD
jgi:hypothetical protein